MEKTKEGYEVPMELTPKWWEDWHAPNDKYIVIPDTEYDNPEGGINYGKGDAFDFRTGIIVKSPEPGDVGRWCHFAHHGTQIIHPFRKRFSTGKQGTIEEKKALVMTVHEVLLIKEKVFYGS